MKLRVAAAAAVVCMATGAAYAAEPTAVVSTSGYSFAEYTGSTAVGAGLINTNELFYIDEQTGPEGKSWYIFVEPKSPKIVEAVITFDAPIVGVLTTDADLAATDATYGAAGIAYATTTSTGLDGVLDSVSYTPGSNQLTIRFAVSDPGDHIRVFTSPVPEPSTYALMAAGLLALGVTKLRRRS